MKNTYNYQYYKEYLEIVSEPISLNQFLKVKMDLRGMMEYAESIGKKVSDLTAEEKYEFISD